MGCGHYGNAKIVDASNLIIPKVSKGSCYAMFYHCPRLTKAPRLTSTTLSNSCFAYMFDSCTSLTECEIAATQLNIDSLKAMFYQCTSLKTIKVNFSSWGYGTPQWLSNASTTGTFYCPAALGTNETITRGISNCPEGWTVVNI